LSELLGATFDRAAARLVLAGGLGIGVVAGFAGLVSVIGSRLGSARPLDFYPFFPATLVLLAGLGVAASLRGRGVVAYLLDGVRPRQAVGFLATLTLPLFSVTAAGRLLAIGDPSWARWGTLIDCVIVLILVVTAFWKRHEWTPPLLYSATLAILLSSSLRSHFLYGWDINKEYGVASVTQAAGGWHIPTSHDAYASMLSLTAFPVGVHNLTGLSLLAFFRVLMPCLIALVPVGVYALLRSEGPHRPTASPGAAVLIAGALILANGAYPVEMVTVTRQGMACVLLVGLLLVWFANLPKRALLGLSAALLLALSYTHYTSSYILAMLTLSAWVGGGIWRKVTRTKAPLVVNGAVVGLAWLTSLGWNMAITANDALVSPTTGITKSGIGLATSTDTSIVPINQMLKLLQAALVPTITWLKSLPGAQFYKVTDSIAPAQPARYQSIGVHWPTVNALAHQAVTYSQVIAVMALAVYLWRHKGKYSIGPTMIGLSIGAIGLSSVVRFSFTAASFFNPERASLVTLIVLAIPLAWMIDSVVGWHKYLRWPAGLGAAGLSTILLASSSGFATLAFGGTLPAAITAHGESIERFGVSSAEVATGVWMQTNLNRSQDLIQTDRYGQLILESHPANYGLFPVLLPQLIDPRSFIYVSTSNLVDGRSRIATDKGLNLSVYNTPIDLLNQHFYVFYSTDETRIYARGY
jgi:hypothetical protein